MASTDAIAIIVTSADGSRTRTYQIGIETSNQAPAAEPIPTVELSAGGQQRLNLDDYFSDPDGDPFSYTLLMAPDRAAATAGLAGGLLSLTAVGAGETTLRLAASDAVQTSDPLTVNVTVAAAPEQKDALKTAEAAD